VSAESAEDLRYGIGEAEERAASPGRSESSFEAFFLAHYRPLYTLLFRITGERARAEELTNDALWKAYRSFSARENGSLDGWLYRIATNLGIEDLRASARRQRYEEAAARDSEFARPQTTPLDDALQAEKRGRVQSVLASLKHWQAQILVLRSNGLSYKELAQALGLKERSVGTMLARAEAQFQKRYFELHESEE
jgi:RNA polymerase sigma-70 factor (ECF subfamily)